MSIFTMFVAKSTGSALAYAVNPLTTIDINTPCIANYTAIFNCSLTDNNTSVF